MAALIPPIHPILPILSLNLDHYNVSFKSVLPGRAPLFQHRVGIRLASMWHRFGIDLASLWHQ